MAIDKDLLGPQNEGEYEAFAIEDLVFSVQIELQKAMRKGGVSNRVLAERLGMTPGRVSQIFSSGGSNLTLKTIARIANALGEEFEFVRKSHAESVEISVSKQVVKLISDNSTRPQWRETTGENSNKKHSPIAA